MKISLNQEITKDNIKGIYIEQKPLVIPIISIIISIFLILFILLPQISAFPTKKTEVDAEEKKLETIRKATEYARTVNNLLLEEDLKIVGQVLPVEKNFEGALNAVSAAANASGVSVGQYEFVLSDTNQGSAPTSGIPSVNFSISIQGSPEQVIEFANELYKTAPISEIREITYSNNAAKISIIFFYKPLSPSGFQDGGLVREMNSEEQDTLNSLKEWSLPLAFDSSGIQVVPSSGSGSLDSSPL